MTVIIWALETVGYLDQGGDWLGKAGSGLGQCSALPSDPGSLAMQ